MTSTIEGMDIEHMRRAYAPDRDSRRADPLRLSFRGTRAAEARWAREEIANHEAWRRAIAAWGRVHGLDPLRRGISWDVDSSRKFGDGGKDDAESVTIDALHILPAATRREIDACHEAFSAGQVEVVWQDDVVVAY